MTRWLRPLLALALLLVGARCTVAARSYVNAMHRDSAGDALRNHNKLLRDKELR